MIASEEAKKQKIKNKTVRFESTICFFLSNSLTFDKKNTLLKERERVKVRALKKEKNKRKNTFKL